MATRGVAYFSDIGGETIEFARADRMERREFAERFPGVKGKPYDGFSFWVGLVGQVTWDKAAGRPVGDWRPVTRIVFLKSNPSRHQCNAACLNARGRVMNCECACNGKNHGRGGLNCA